MNKNQKVWMYSFAAAVVGGAANAAGGALGAMAAGISVFTGQFWTIVGGAFFTGGLISALAFLKQSPLPKQE